MFLYIKQNVNSLCRNLFTDFLQFYRRRKSVQVFLHIKKVAMYGIEIPISTYRTQGAITFKVLSLKHTEISASQYFLYYKKMHYSASLHFILYLYTDLVFGFACVLYCSDPFKLYFKSLYGGVYNTLCHSCRIYLKHFFCNLRYSVLRHIV